ncbi:hypothetical protein COLSTE_02055 [Collinsella stercoris DSM 13279]|uniref:Uncharacterized protein n=1 Tax=Collinsella stercoris DSM 13279 TaxID=445975 RepID=B6GD77_9ACTN|nr:hypothetical protein COLSTE_02055 [Collinsella stercoris DSM 13279]
MQRLVQWGLLMAAEENVYSRPFIKKKRPSYLCRMQGARYS